LFVAASLVMGQAPGVEESSPPDNFASAIAGTQVHDQPQLPGESGAEPSGAVQAAPTIVVSYPASPAQTASPASTAPSASSESSKEPKRRALPSPFDSPPFPGSEYQGYPLIGVPADNTIWPLMQAIQGTWYSDLLNASRTRVYGWVTAEANWSTSRHSNTPDS